MNNDKINKIFSKPKLLLYNNNVNNRVKKDKFIKIQYLKMKTFQIYFIQI